ncbi:hypothetical protein KEM52_001472 [Ascosphaera acerosa]|nr:hypothetical protein KEM52_001472 [Ascosphaera acerosa]
MNVEAEREEEEAKKGKKQGKSRQRDGAVKPRFGRSLDDFEDSAAEEADSENADSEDDAASDSASDAESDSSDSSSDSDSAPQTDTDSEADILSDDDARPDKRGLTKLHKFVSTLEPATTTVTNKSALANPMAAVQGAAPTDFGLLPSRKLTAADLIPTLSDSRLKSSLKYVDAEPATAGASSSGVPGKLAAPLPQRVQDRIDRAAAFEKSKQTLDRWLDTVKHNRRAEHLSFPLPEPGHDEQARIQDSQPRTALETAIQSILAESGLARDEDGGEGGDLTAAAEARLREAEDAQARKLPLEEIQRRRAELRKARELMFREEARAKRIKKIKSKAYRRVHRKERERLEQREREAGVGGADEEDEEAAREAADRARALARMGAKHRESKFARELAKTGRAAWDDEARQNVLDAARRKEELQSRIEDRRVRDADGGEEYLSTSSSGSDDDDDESGSEAGGFAGDADTAVTKLHRKLDKLSAGETAAPAPTGPYAKLMNMKFMQTADAARRAVNDAEIKALRRELASGDASDGPGGENGDGDGDVGSDDEAGRFKFGQTEKAKKIAQQPLRDFEAPADRDGDGDGGDGGGDDVEIVINDTRASETAKTKSRKSKKAAPLSRPASTTAPGSDEETSNPWLAEPGQEKRRNRKAVDVGAETVLISSGEAVTEKVEKSMPTPAKQQKQVQAPSRLTVLHGDDDDDTSSDESASVPVLLKNAELVKRAFAGDDVLDTFEQEKHETMAAEDDQVVDMTLPGWGAWVGDGLTKREKKAQRRQATSQVVQGIKAADRKDARLERVIINEKRQRKAVKYMASQLPHPFESRAQYERALRLPVGPEWTTKATFQEATKPRVMVKQGIIKPMQKPMV